MGRRSGATYETPIVVAAVPAGFIAELTYGDRVNWYRNVVAAGHCQLLVGGVTYEIGGIDSYPTDLGLQAFGVPRRWILQALRRREFRLLRTSV